MLCVNAARTEGAGPAENPAPGSLAQAKTREDAIEQGLGRGRAGDLVQAPGRVTQVLGEDLERLSAPPLREHVIEGRGSPLESEAVARGELAGVTPGLARADRSGCRNAERVDPRAEGRAGRDPLEAGRDPGGRGRWRLGPIDLV